MSGAIIVGASSGIGAALARTLAENGYEVGLTARREKKLEEIARELPTRSYIAPMDVTEQEEARTVFAELAAEMGDVDLVVVSAGVASGNRDADWEPDRQTIETNVSGFAALATAALSLFETQGHGHLVGISSVSAHIGLPHAPAYSGSKAFVSNYLEALRGGAVAENPDILISTIEPGYVDTDLSFGGFWECSPETAARQIYTAIENERIHAYVPRRWRLVAAALTVLPESVCRRFVQ